MVVDEESGAVTRRKTRPTLSLAFVAARDANIEVNVRPTEPVRFQSP